MTDEQLDLLDRIRTRRYATAQKDEDSFVEFDWAEGMFPLSSAPRGKKAFMPSEYERKMVNKLVIAIKQGRITMPSQRKDQSSEEELPYDIWDTTDNSKLPALPQLQAPKAKLPGHNESYNPSAEYLFDEQETKDWQEEDPDARQIDFLPKTHSSLRHVHAYDNLVLERFERCMDLYLLPRLRKKKLDIDPDSLLPQLPKPEELRPFPTQVGITYEGHSTRVRSISVSKNGQYLASCDEGGLLIVWDVDTGRKVRQIQRAKEINY